MPITLNGTTGITTPSIDASAGNSALTTLSVGGNNISAVNSMGFRNRIINGDMQIDQRNAGASVTVTNAATSFFGVDRFFTNRANGYANTASTVQQVTDAPAGFIKSVRYTNASAEVPTGAFYSNIQQYVEGFNVADFGWGTSNAVSATLSFWVKISVTGTFGVVLRSSGADRSYAISFVYNSANTWQFVTATIPGPTSGTFGTDNNTGFSVNWDLGVGPSLSISATGAWQSANALGLTGGIKVNSTAGATYQITGVQLEAGSVATPFERIDVGRELILCQRYYEKSYDLDVVPGSNANGSWDGPLSFISGAGFGYTSPAYFKATKRATPTITGFPENGGASGTWRSQATGGTVTSRTFNVNSLNTNSFSVALQTNDVRCFGHWTASAEL